MKKNYTPQKISNNFRLSPDNHIFLRFNKYRQTYREFHINIDRQIGNLIYRNISFIFGTASTIYTLCTFLPCSSIKANLTYGNFLFILLETHRQTCHMLTAQPSTYPFFFQNANMYFGDGSAINIWHVCIYRAIW